MLVVFTCDAYADITLFGDVATRLLKMMGHSGTVPSAILAEDVPAALTRLQQALLHAESTPEAEEEVSIGHRALPIIKLLQAASKEKCSVMWAAA